ncbi:glycerophosphodiester phosphodiesterase family protein [Novosphingobium album (ex Liu et al. 2023)]|uniref:Glycerophosphodiester phosphodiesterase family protein n=1 Tax=Novosphingobium album (ex Liu et al. 2023) TaxID=3031130 RepID=A0ABT5WKZ9_9SPHN|nr:glycerophosphodiester phosphodiesterase family protein [Novosphingobium album (ex Liu et al. 2023)]MDE8650702.1 glycerophosphodiester phosphodiesterase family protein [Novosphingobium album (ex Liu et al. 2023)]
MRISSLFVLAATLCLNMPAPSSAAPASADRAAFETLRARVLRPPAGHVIVVAHRACFAAAPENSPQAIDACWRQGVEVVENDVRSTKDGELVLMHDNTVDRTTTGWGYLDDLTLADLGKLKLRDGAGGAGAPITPYPVTTLRDYFRAAKNKVMINLELKPSASASFEVLLEKSLQIAEEEGVLDHIILKVPDTFSHGKVSKEHILGKLKLPKGLAIWPIIWQASARGAPGERLGGLEAYGPAGYEVPFLGQEFFRGIAADKRVQGRPVMAVAVEPYWSGGFSDDISMPNPDAGWGRLIALGANVIMTDHPEYLLRYLCEMGHRHTGQGEAGCSAR